MTDIEQLVLELARELGGRGLKLATAESCTGGGIAQALTEVAGASDWFDRGFVTYSNDAKMEMLGVSAATLERHGAVSEGTVLEMARGALARSPAQLSVAVSGVAGPGGGSADKPVGTVWIGWAATPGWSRAELFHFPGNRSAVRRATIAAALQGLRAHLDGL
ncbi:CinA family protein [Alloalcanivorax gelatiniphagus]|uniref:CinA family protein n=1 Tax=Alloalcanivorax gelatiniphagus TaxID=1194167 RepID=A0ABY2XP58_9GAMM|nr:CinA family protein [Alloalcanivorax gelatiniphagus]TMW13699.1 CinA family protein [Alloalcanivorax gelatiniphagus]